MNRCLVCKWRTFADVCECCNDESEFVADKAFERILDLAATGAATEMMFKACRNVVKMKVYDGGVEFKSIEDLLEWADGREEQSL